MSKLLILLFLLNKGEHHAPIQNVQIIVQETIHENCFEDSSPKHPHKPHAWRHPAVMYDGLGLDDRPEQGQSPLPYLTLRELYAFIAANPPKPYAVLLPSPRVQVGGNNQERKAETCILGQ